MFIRLMITLLLICPPLAALEVEHAQGTTRINSDPQRVVTLTNEATEAALALGFTPVGASQGWQGDPWYPHLTEALANTRPLGLENNINLERTLMLQPDLILGNQLRQGKLWPLLSQMAPTVYSETLKGEWQENFILYARALNKEAEGQALLDAYQQRLQSLAERIGSAGMAREVSLVRFMPGRTRIYYRESFAGVLLDQLGFARPASQNREQFAAAVTKERISEMDGDLLFYFVYETGDGKAEQTADEWMSDPLWQNLKVVKSGQIHRVDDIIWNNAGGIIAANKVLDDLERLLAEKLALR